MDSLKLATIATHVAASKTMILHPASHTHRQMNDEQLAEAGVSPGMIRLSVGIENVDGITKRIKNNFKKSGRTSEMITNITDHFQILPDFYFQSNSFFTLTNKHLYNIPLCPPLPDG